MHILIVDDQRSAILVLSRIVEKAANVTIHTAGSLAEARTVLREQPITLAFVDLRLRDDPRNRDGLVLVEEIGQQTHAVAVVVSAYAELAEVRAAMRRGAYDYVLKEDLSEETILPIVERLRSHRELEGEVNRLRARLRTNDTAFELIGSSPPMQQLRAVIGRVAKSDRAVLVRGPSGAGKELVVRAIHRLGLHPDAPLVDLNCGAFSETLVESQLFGHERGAFTGADRRHVGFMEDVGQGTLFLDEIAELPSPLQAKLLRALESREFRSVGGTTPLRFSGRLVAATHVDLERRVTEGRFREDLYFRLNVLEVWVPSLGERLEDVPALVAHFARGQPRPLRFTDGALARMQAMSWPGNVRQLRNLVDRLVLLTDDDPVTESTIDHVLRPATQTGTSVLDRVAAEVLALDVGDKLAAIERAVLLAALRRAGGNKSAAARLLGVNRKVVERRVDQLEGEGDVDDGGERHDE